MNATDQLVSRIVETIDPLRIILFGSAARGDTTPDSDIDVLVVMPDGTPRLRTAQQLQLRMFGIPVAVDILVATQSDLQNNRENIGLIYKTILREGKEVYVAA